jgi:hypothetical protein
VAEWDCVTIVPDSDQSNWQVGQRDPPSATSTRGAGALRVAVLPASQMPRDSLRRTQAEATCWHSTASHGASDGGSGQATGLPPGHAGQFARFALASLRRPKSGPPGRRRTGRERSGVSGRSQAGARRPWTLAHGQVTVTRTVTVLAARRPNDPWTNSRRSRRLGGCTVRVRRSGAPGSTAGDLPVRSSRPTATANVLIRGPS